MDDSARLHESLASAGLADAAHYAVSMAYRIRFYVEMNAREAMHVIELRTAPQGHPAYRRVCQQMHRLIADQAGHTAIAAAMTFADHSEVELERLKSERALDAPDGERKTIDTSSSSLLGTSRAFQKRLNSSRNVSVSNDFIRSKNSTPSR